MVKHKYISAMLGNVQPTDGELSASPSILTYRQLKRQVVQPMTEVVCKLFNTLHVVKINHEYHFVYSYVAF
jgi:hypothetical protein